MRSSAVFGFLICCLVVAGCGGGRLPLYTVSGTVLVDGEPAAGAVVYFVPKNVEDELGQRQRPVGVADDEGGFRLTTFTRHDGAAPGEYGVLIQWPADGESNGGDRLGGKYFRSDDVKLQVTVEPRSNRLDPFELSTR